MGFLGEWLTAIGVVLAQSGPYLLAGFVIAGLLKVLLPEKLVYRHLGADAAAKTVQRRAQLLRRKRKTTAQVQRRGRMVQAQSEDTHTSDYKIEPAKPLASSPGVLSCVKTGLSKRDPSESRDLIIGPPRRHRPPAGPVHARTVRCTDRRLAGQGCLAA